MCAALLMDRILSGGADVRGEGGCAATVEDDPEIDVAIGHGGWG